MVKQAFSRFFLLILSTLGLASCITDRITDPDPVEYGCPHADFLLDGTVVNAETKEPIPGIEIKFQEETTFSDEKASWYINTRGTPFPKTYFIVASDVDGADNGGVFEPDTFWIDPDKTKPGSGWYVGTFEQHDIVIEMDEVQEESD